MAPMGPGRRAVVALAVVFLASLLPNGTGAIAADVAPAAPEARPTADAPNDAPDTANYAAQPRDAVPPPPPLPVAPIGEPSRPAGPTEIAGARTETSRTFDNHDGTVTTELHTSPIHYRTAATAAWQPVELDFVAAPAGERTATVAKSAAPVTVAPPAAESAVIELAFGDRRIALRPAERPNSLAAAAPPVLDGPRAHVRDVFPGVDLRVFARADGVTSFLVLGSAAAGSSFTFLVDAPGLTLEPVGDGSLRFVDAKGATVATMPAPYAVDSTPDPLTGSGQMTSEVTYTVGSAAGTTSLTVAVSEAWLAMATYPVYVDPVVTLYSPSTNAYGDAHVNQGNPTFNYANYQRPDSPYYYEMWLGLSPSNSTYYNEALIKFDLSSLAGQTIDIAELQVFPYHQYYDAPTATTTWLRRVTSDWTESGVTWNTKPAITTTGTVTDNLVEGVRSSFIITSLVQGWVSGTYSNYGLRLDENGNGATYWKRLIASEQGTNASPRLNVTYHAPTATPTTPSDWTDDPTVSWAYADAAGHPQTHYQVEVATNAGFSPLYAASGTVASGAGWWTIPGTLAEGTTYHWRVRVSDGMSWSPWSSSSIAWDSMAPAIGAFTAPAADPTYIGAANTWQVAWSPAATDSPGSGIYSLRVIQDYGAVVAPGTCDGVSYVGTTSWYVATGATSTTAGSGMSGYCYVYTLEVTDNAGHVTTTGQSHPVLLDLSAPAPTFTIPAPATTVQGASLIASLAWDDTDAGGSGIAARLLQRQAAPLTGGACSATWTNDGTLQSASTASYADAGLTRDTCYRWLLTVTDRSGNVGATATSGTFVATVLANLGQGRSHTFETWDLGGGDSLAINTATGNLVISHPVVTLPIRGSSLTLGLTYNHQDPAAVGMSPGWRLNVFRRLALNPDGTVTFTDTDGARHTFISPQTTGSVTTYTRPAALYATLVKDTSVAANEFVLTHRDGSRDKFDIAASEGLLVRAEDRFGNGVTLAYAGSTNRISTITDTAGSRVVTFSWDASNRLTQITDWAWISGGVVQATATGALRAYRFFYDAGTGRLAGWSTPLNTTGSCPTGGSHLTCISYFAGGLDVTKTQTITTTGASALGSTTRAITTKVTFSGQTVASVKDAEQVAAGGPGVPTTFAWVTGTRLEVARPTTRTGFGLATANDPYGRIASVWRMNPGAGTEIERRTAWDTAHPVEPASVTDNYGALLGTPARTVTYEYVANSMGLVAKLVEPLTASPATSRLTEYTYNANNDVTLRTVSRDGSSTERTVTRYCYSTQSLTCPTNETGPNLVRRLDNWVSSGPQDDDTNVATDYAYDGFGRQTSVTRHNRAPDGSVRDDRVDAFVYDAAGRGSLEREITNHIDGVVTNNTLDTTPGADSVRTDLTTVHSYDTAGNRISTADPRRAIGLAVPATEDVTFTTVADAHVGSANPSTNYGLDTTLQVRATGGSTGAYEPYLRFTVTGIVGTVSAARLRLHNTVTSNKTGRNVCVFRVPTTSWTEGALTWNTKPASDAAALACIVGNQAAGSIDFNLDTAISGPGEWAFRLTNDTTTAVTYASDEHATSAPPQLILTIVNGTPGSDDYVTRWTHDPLNQRLSETTPTTPGIALAQKTQTSVYDELGALRVATDFGGIVTGTEFDRAGRATRAFEDTDGAGSAAPVTTSISTYTADGRVMTVKDRRQAADGSLGSTTYAYDPLGRQTDVTEAAGTADAALTATDYDALDRRILLDVAGQVTDYAYDLGGRTTKTDDGFACTTGTHDYRDLAVTTRDGLAGTTCAAAANTRTVTNTYDGMGRLLRAEVTEGASLADRTTDDTYDSAGLRLSAATRKSGVTATTTFTVNRLDRTVAEARPDGATTKSTFDAAGNSTDRCYWKPGAAVGDCLVVGTTPWPNPPTQSTSSVHDARNSRVQQVDGLTNQLTTYDPAHNYAPAAVYLPTGQGRELQTLLTYDSRHRLATVTHQTCLLASTTSHACAGTPTDVGSVSYAYDLADNRTGVAESNGAASSDRRYCYDARNQVVFRNTGAPCSATAKDESNTYDDAGNRLTATVGATTTNFAYTSDGQLCDVETAPTAASCSGGNVTYDTAGRTRSYAGWWFAYDADGRLTSACRNSTCAAGADKLEFAYDGEGHRTRQTATSAGGSVSVTDFRYQGNAVVEEAVGGVVTRSYVVDEAGGIVKLVVPSGADAGTYLVTWNGHGDALGLHRQNADGTTTLANSYTYDTWGRPATATHNGIADLGFRFLYVGRHDVQWDDAFGAGLLYMHARHYSPTLGRFLQPDPAEAEGNLYAYAENSPVTKIDPSGTIFDTLLDLIFIGIDVIVLATDSNPANRETNQLALAADIGAAFVPFATGTGLAVRSARAVLTKAPKIGKLFTKLGIPVSEHALKQIGKRTRQGRITEELAVRAYCRGSLYWDTQTRRYIRRDNASGVFVVIEGSIRGKVWTIAEGTTSPRWKPVKWRASC